MFNFKTAKALKQKIDNLKEQICSLSQQLGSERRLVETFKDFYSASCALGQIKPITIEHIKHGQKFYKINSDKIYKRIILCEKNKEGKELYASMAVISDVKNGVENFNLDLTKHGWLSKEELFEKIKSEFYIPVDDFFENFPRA